MGHQNQNRPSLAHHRSARPRHQPRLTTPGQDQARQQVIRDNGLETRDRAAAILILVFGQHAENIAQLIWDDATVTEELVTIQLGTIKIALLDPLAQPWQELAANPGHELAAAHPNSKWLFRGASPGRHINPGHLTTCLIKLFRPRAARLGTLHELANSRPSPSSPKPSATPPPP